MNNDQRFADPGTALIDLKTHFVVHCPKCMGKAWVNPTPDGTSKDDYRLTCTTCFHVERPGHWYGAATAFVSVKCRECHAPLRRSAPWDGQWRKLAMHCDECGDDCEYEAHISRYPVYDGQVTDPIFGLPLWLQKEFREELLWAYNYEHLELLRQYITAKLRERGIRSANIGSKNRAMVGRLPAFIKKAANREALLKLVENLANK